MVLVLRNHLVNDLCRRRTKRAHASRAQTLLQQMWRSTTLLLATLFSRLVVADLGSEATIWNLTPYVLRLWVYNPGYNYDFGASEFIQPGSSAQFGGLDELRYYDAVAVLQRFCPGVTNFELTSGTNNWVGVAWIGLENPALGMCRRGACIPTQCYHHRVPVHQRWP